MSYPNSELSAGQFLLIAIVVVTGMAIWLTAIFVAARDPWRGHAAVTELPPASATEDAEDEAAA